MISGAIRDRVSRGECFLYDITEEEEEEERQGEEGEEEEEEEEEEEGKITRKETTRLSKLQNLSLSRMPLEGRIRHCYRVISHLHTSAVGNQDPPP